MLIAVLFSCTSIPEVIKADFPARTVLHAELSGDGADISSIEGGWRIKPTRTGPLSLKLKVPQCPEQRIDLNVSSGKSERKIGVSLDCEMNVGKAAFRLIPPGRFDMGSPPDEEGRQSDELLHPVALTSGYWMATTETTQSFFLDVSSESPALRKVGECSLVGNAADPAGFQPVYCISWYEALEFANLLSEKEGLQPCYQVLTKTAVWKEGCTGYRLPTEAEWEYAAVANQSFRYAGGNTIDDFGWHKTNSMGRSHTVAQKKPNAFGLYDMSVNVSEWVWDRYEEHKTSAESDPRGPGTGGYRVIRGGNWSKEERGLRHADRVDFLPFYRIDDTGFRLVKAYDPTEKPL